MADEKITVFEQKLEQEERELREQYERLGLDPDLTTYPEYRGTRLYENANKRRFGISGDLKLDPTQLELFELNERVKVVLGLLTPQQRAAAVRFLNLNERAMACCSRVSDLSYGWGLLHELRPDLDETDPQLFDKIDQKRDELRRSSEPYHAIFNLMAGFNTCLLNGESQQNFRRSVDERIGKPEEKRMANEVLADYETTIYDTADFFAQAGSQWAKYQEMDPEERPEFSEVVMDVQEYMPGLIDPFIAQEASKTRLTTAQKEFAVQNFDRLFGTIYPENTRAKLTAQGKDVFDLIYINGKSMNQLWEEEYARASYDYASEQMKCRFIEAALSPQRIQILIPREDGDQILPFSVVSRQQRLAGAITAATAGRPQPSISDAVALQASQQALEDRSQYEKDEKRRRIESRTVHYPEMDPVVPEERARCRIMVYGASMERMKGVYENLYKLSAVKGRIGSAQINPDEKRSMLRDAARVYEDMAIRTGLEVYPYKHPVYKSMGIEDQTQLFFIDGQPVYEYLKAHGGGDLNPASPEDQNLVKAEIMAALIRGEHRVEMAKVGMDEYGTYQIGVVSAQPDLSPFDGLESWYQKKPSKKAENLYQKDDKRDERISSIRQYLGDRLREAETRRLKLQEDPYLKAKNRYFFAYMNGEKAEAMLESMFGKENVDWLESHKSRLPVDWKRGGGREMGGIRVMTLFLTMADHPYVHFADLSDPKKFAEEKQASARKVMNALKKYYEPEEGTEPDVGPLGEIMTSIMRRISKTDLKQEILYALGAPEELSAKEVEDLMARRNPEVTEFLNSVAQASQAMMQSLSFEAKNLQDDVLYENPGSNALDREISRRLSMEEKDAFASANAFLGQGLTAERKMAEYAKNYRENPNQDFDLRYMKAQQTFIRDLISKEGRISRYPVTLSLTARLMATSPLSESAQEKLDKQFPKNPAQERQSLFAYLYGQREVPKQMKDLGNALMKAGMERFHDETLCNDDTFFPNDKRVEERFTELEDSTQINTIRRIASRANMIRLFTLGDDQISVDQVLSSGSLALCRRKAREFEQALNDHPMKDVSPEKQSESIDFYAHMYAKAADRLCQAHIPDIDWSDPTQVISQMQYLSLMGHMAVDYSQTMTTMLRNHKEEFQEAYDPERFRSHENILGSLQFFAQNFEHAMDPKYELVNRLSCKLTAERVGKLFRGAKVGDLASIMTPHEINIYQMALVQVLEDQKPDKKAMEDYLNGETKEWPIDSKALDDTLESFGIMVNFQKPEAQAQAQPQAQTQPQPQARRRVDLKEVQDKERQESQKESSAPKKKDLKPEREAAPKKKPQGPAI